MVGYHTDMNWSSSMHNITAFLAGLGKLSHVIAISYFAYCWGPGSEPPQGALWGAVNLYWILLIVGVVAEGQLAKRRNQAAEALFDSMANLQKKGSDTKDK